LKQATILILKTATLADSQLAGGFKTQLHCSCSL